MVKRFVGVLIDLSKALNSVEHSLIISKSNLSPITLGMPQGFFGASTYYLLLDKHKKLFEFQTNDKIRSLS